MGPSSGRRAKNDGNSFLCSGYGNHGWTTTHNVVDQKLKTGTKRFVLLISSPGGSVFAGLSAYHYLKGVPASVETFNFGEVDSIATVIYCAGSKRYSVPQGRFLLHGISANFAANVPMDQGLISEQLKLMQQQSSSIASVISETVKRPIPEIESILSQHTVYSAPEAQNIGLVTEIRSKLYDEGADLVSIGANETPTGQPTRVLAKDNTYTTNINTLFSTIPDFPSRLSDFSTQPRDVFSSPIDFPPMKTDQ